MKKNAPELDINRFLQYLENPKPSLEDEQWLHEQLGSKAFRDGLWALGHKIFPEQFCRACIAALPYYVHLEVMGENAEAEYPQIKAHLDLCSRCSSEHEKLGQAVTEAYTGEIIGALSYPSFDFSFLPRMAGMSIPDWPQLWENISSAGVEIHRLVSEITLSLTTLFKQLATPLRPALVVISMPAQRKQGMPAEEAETIEMLDLQYPPANFLVRIGRGPVVAQKTALVIDVLQMEPPEPIQTAQVTLCDSQRRLMERVGTDTAGTVRFEDIGVGKYLVRVQHEEDVWELPIIVAP